MKTRTVLLTLVLCFLAGSVCFASDIQMGTWKLNEAKSKIAAGTPKNSTVVYEAAGDSIKVTIDGNAPDGTATHSEWTGKFDGKDYPSTGNPNEDMRSVKEIDDHTLDVTSKKGGKVVLTAHVVVAADGKIYCATEEGTVHVIKAGPTLEVLAKNELGEPCLATPAISQGVLYFRTSGSLITIG